MTPVRNQMSVPGTVCVLEDLYRGHWRWDALAPWPEQPPADRREGDEAVARLHGLLVERVDPEEIDRRARLPEGLVDALQEAGFLRMRVAPEHGGSGLSHYSTFRVVLAAARWSMPVALVLAIENSVGVGPLVPFLPNGPLRDLLIERLRAGTVSGLADTEPEGAANLGRSTVAVPTEDGHAYRLTGSKLYVGNAPIAGLLLVSASVPEHDGRHRRLFVVDADSPGVRDVGTHEYMGVRGFPNGHLRFDDVLVPAERMVPAPPRDDIRITMESAMMIIVGRLHMIAAPSLAVADNCAQWIREFVAARAVDDRPLAEYGAIQQRVAESAADVFAAEAVVEWCLLGPGLDEGRNVMLDQSAAKNIVSIIGWRAADRAMSILAGEGYESASSKATRGAERTHPLERAMRDVRNFRISGGVDFQLDFWTSQMAVFTYYYPDPDSPSRGEDAELSLSSRNAEHRRALDREAREFGETCRRLAAHAPDITTLAADQRRMALVAEWAHELFAGGLVLARASHLDARGDRRAQGLADVFCTAARHRMAATRHQLADGDTPDYAEVTREVLAAETSSGRTRVADDGSLTT